MKYITVEELLRLYEFKEEYEKITGEAFYIPYSKPVFPTGRRLK